MNIGTLRLVQATRFRVAEMPPRCSGPRDVYELMKLHAERELVEVFWVLALNTQHQIIREPIIITIGTLDASLVHPREVFRPAILLGAASIILCHNHPSGEPTPSAEDKVVTKQLMEAGAIIGIPVLDHIVVGHGRYVSFVESGLLT